MADEQPAKRQRTSPPPSQPPIQNRNQSPPQSPPRIPPIQTRNQSSPILPMYSIQIRNRTNIDWGLYNRHPPMGSYEEYLMARYKLFPCEKTHNHDLDACPFKHPGDPAARRDPHLYRPQHCSAFQKSRACSGGDNCPLAHGDFELGLHPNYYKMQECARGLSCNLPFCFNSHGEAERRYFYGHDIPGQAAPRLGLGRQAPIPVPDPPGLPISPLTRESFLRHGAHAYTRIEGRQGSALHLHTVQSGGAHAYSTKEGNEGSSSQAVGRGDTASEEQREDPTPDNVETGDGQASKPENVEIGDSQASKPDTPEGSHSDDGGGED